MHTRQRKEREEVEVEGKPALALAAADLSPDRKEKNKEEKRSLLASRREEGEKRKKEPPTCVWVEHAFWAGRNGGLPVLPPCHAGCKTPLAPHGGH